MELGSKLRQARLDLGLSQRQLCGDVITRNMLSQIENGSARPSMDTLVYLAGVLKKPVSYFLEEAATGSPNAGCIANARAAYAEKRFADAEQILQEYQAPDELLDAEYGLLKYLSLIGRAEQSLNRPIYARQLLEQARQLESPYITAALQNDCLLLLAQVSKEPVQLPVDDRPLLYRAKRALEMADAERCIVLLEACEMQETEQWHYLRAQAAFAQEDYALAATYYPADCYEELEECYRNLGDYKMAYEYACKRRKSASNLGSGNV